MTVEERSKPREGRFDKRMGNFCGVFQEKERAARRASEPFVGIPMRSAQQKFASARADAKRTLHRADALSPARHRNSRMRRRTIEPVVVPEPRAADSRA